MLTIKEREREIERVMKHCPMYGFMDKIIPIFEEMVNKHTNDFRAKCSKCDKEFNTLWKKWLHEEKEHGMKHHSQFG